MTLILKVYLDLNDDGDYSDASEDISSYVLAASWSEGFARQQQQQIPMPGIARATVDNYNNEFSPEHASALTGLTRGIGMRFRSEYTALSGALSVGDTYTHRPSQRLLTIIRFTLDTLPSSGNVDIAFRYQDTNNWHAFRTNASGDIILRKNDGGSGSDSDSTAGVLSGGEEIEIEMDGSSITLYYDGTSSATDSDFQTEIDGYVVSLGTGGAASDLIIDRPQWEGRLREIQPAPGQHGPYTADLIGYDWLDDAQRDDEMPLSVATSQRTDQLVSTAMQAGASNPPKGAATGAATTSPGAPRR